MKYCLAVMLLAVLTSLSISISAQQISGKVLRETGTGAGHVNVEFKDKSNKVFTNPDGTFTIMAKKLPDTLVFSSPGFEPYSVVVTEKTVKDVNFEVVLLSKREKTSIRKDDAAKISYRSDLAPFEKLPGVKDSDKVDTMPVWSSSDPTRILKYLVVPSGYKSSKKGEEYSELSTMELRGVDFASTPLSLI